ncbi:MAG: hypothetical protein ACMUHY_08820 [Thermoplasmatota archaeon]
MNKTENKRRIDMGISIPAVVALIAAVSVAAASSVVIIGMEMAETVKDDDFTDPFFHMKAEPMHQDSAPLETVKYKIWFDTEIYYYTPIKLEVRDMFDGVISYIYPEVIHPGENATLELTAQFEGEFFRDVVGSYNGLKDSVRVTLSVDDEPDEYGFDLKATPDERTAFPYQWVYYSITMDTDGDFDGYVHLDVEEFYDCCLVSLFPRVIYPGQTAVLALCGMIPGEFTRNVTGTHGAIESSVEVELHVMMETY